LHEALRIAPGKTGQLGVLLPHRHHRPPGRRTGRRRAGGDTVAGRVLHDAGPGSLRAGSRLPHPYRRQTMPAAFVPAVPGHNRSPVDGAPSHVKAIAPYRPGKPIEEVAREYGLDPARIVKLASNENPLGMPESARAAIQRALDELSRYPDGNGFELKAAISRKYGVPAEWITLGNGSNDVLELVARAVCAAGQSIVYAQYSFAVYALSTQAIGARAIVVPAVDHGHDLEA